MNRTLSQILLIGLCGALPVSSLRAVEGVPPEVDEMYLRGLRYLAAAQNANGSYPGGSGSEPAVVGLAALAMLARGADPNFGPYKENIRRSIDYILSMQNAETGYIGSSMYNHGFSTLALAELYGAVEDPRLGPALKKAVDLILTAQAQNPFRAWRYGPTSQDADTTVSGAQLVALFAARNAGLPVPDEAIEAGLKFLKQCQSQDGGIGYTNPGGSNAPRTAIALLAFALARQYEDRSFAAALKYLRSDPGSEDNYYHYYLYYAAQAWFQASPEEWKRWNAALARELQAAQTSEGNWEGQFGPAFTTSASLLALALNYRLLPIYER
jgi:hypothetical protein